MANCDLLDGACRLWGNPSHLKYVATALRERHGEDRLYILAAQSNAGNNTYDGIELGGERVAHEIEETLGKLSEQGYRIKKLSVVGYSMGGLVARYAIGLLEAHGWFNKLEPVNFTTFASPHVGVRSPVKGVWSYLFNVLGPRTLSMSGKQMFMVDKFRDTGKPLLSVLATPDSIFMRGLARFKNRAVYGNIINDRSTVFYTTAISKVDPFHDPENTRFNYISGYEPVIIDMNQYIAPHVDDAEEGNAEERTSSAVALLRRYMVGPAKRAPFYLFLVCFVPVSLTLFLLASVVQTFRSNKRIQLHNEGKAGIVPTKYRVPVMVRDMQGAVEDVFENVNASQDPEYLDEDEEGYADHNMHNGNARKPPSKEKNAGKSPTAESPADDVKYPLLALTREQFDIIDSLNAIGFRKYPVYIHKAMHSHAAIIVRMPRESFSEGKIVVKHWLDNEFEL